MSTNKNLNKNEFQPSNEWFNNYRLYSIDYHLTESLLDDIDSKLYEVSCHLDDPEFVQSNFPSYSNMEMEDFIEMDYKDESSFIKNLQIFIKNEQKRLNNIQNGFSKNEKKWLEIYGIDHF